jgi:hypothetical protein
MTEGVVFGVERQLPAFGGFHGVGRAEDHEVGNGAQGGQVLDRLVGRAVLAQADGIVGADVDHPDAHQGGQPDRRAAVVGEDQEGAAVGDHPAVQGQAVHRRRHAELAHAIVHIAPGIVGGVEDGGVLDEGVVRAGQVGRAADQFGNVGEDFLQRRARVLAGGGGRLGLLGLGDPGVQPLEGVLRQLAGDGALEDLGAWGEAARRVPRPCGPCRPCGRRRARASGPRPARRTARAASRGWPAGGGDLGLPSALPWVSWCLRWWPRPCRSSSCRRSGSACPDGWPISGRGLDLAHVMAVDGLHRPAGGLEARLLVGACPRG